jgi:hypothetical protein
MTMTTYHRIGTRSFFKIYGNGTICHVMNKQNWSLIKFGINGFLIEDVTDAYYKLAYDRISLQRIDI